MAKKVDIVLRSDYSLEACLAKLAEQIDVDDRTLFSFSGYKGKKPVIGRIEANDFRLHKRRYWRNDFGPVLFGRMTADGRGTLVEAYWEMWRSVRIFMRVWLGFAILIGTPIFLKSLWCAIIRRCAEPENLWVGLVVPPAMVLFGLLLPRLGALLGFHERKAIVELLERILVAGRTPVPSVERTWESSADVFRLWV